MPRTPKREKPRVEVWRRFPLNLDQIVRDGPLTAEEIETASRRFKKALIDQALGGELTHHLGYPPGAGKPEFATIIATAPAGRPSSPTTARSRLRSRAIARGPSSRS